MGKTPHSFAPILIKILSAPHPKKEHWVKIVSFIPKKKPAGLPAGLIMV
jgi:hypothetical protein